MIEDLRSFYEKEGINYETLLHRLLNKESLLRKYLNLFINDPTYVALIKAYEIRDYDQIILAAHTLKGLSLNLNFTKLGTLSSSLVSELQIGNRDDVDDYMAKITKEYQRIIKELEA